jgi:phage I-like protein
MNSQILNREFQHPSDGWYQIEAKGDHPNRAAGVVQVIDDEATQSIVNRFNADAKSGALRHGNEMLIDHEHFKDQPDQETRAYGWLQELQNRTDGIYGRIRWTATGKTAVDGGDYRFFSTEYDPNDLKLVNDGKTKKVRPLRLDGLSLTNMNNNRGQKPITNREKDFAGARATADTTETNQQPKGKMKSVCTLLGLSAEADEASVHAAVSKFINRGDITLADLTTLKNRATELETENKTLLEEQVDALMDAHGIKADDKVRNRLKPTLIGYKNREERIAALVDFGFKPVEAAKGAETAQQRQLRNRDTHQPEKNSTAAGLDEKELAQKAEAEVQDYKIRNRCSYGEARNAVRTAKPELFGIK